MTYNAEDFTPEKVAEALREAVKSKPEGHVYIRQPRPMPKNADPRRPVFPDWPDAPWGKQCLYVHEEDGEKVPGCIVGTALHSLGVPLDVFAPFEGKNVNALRMDLPLPLTQEGWRMLSLAQHEQDSNSTWAEAVESALSEVVQYFATPQA